MPDQIPLPNYSQLIERLFTLLDSLLSNYIKNSYGALVDYLIAPLGLAVVLYIVLMGISITQGWVKLSMSNFVRSAIKISLIYLAAMNWDWFSHYVVVLLNDVAGEIGDVLMKSTPVKFPRLAGLGINAAMQVVLIEFTKIGSWVWAQGGMTSYSPYLTAVLIWGFGYALIIVAVFELVLAKVMMAILFGTAPLFISFTLFKPTHSFFDRWLGACVGFSLLMIFVSSMLALALSMAQWAIADTYLSKATGISLVGFLPSVLVGFIGVGIILKSAQLAQSIGGTITTASGSALLAGTVGGVIGGSLNSMRLASPLLRSAKFMSGGVLKSAKEGASSGASLFRGIQGGLMRGGKE